MRVAVPHEHPRTTMARNLGEFVHRKYRPQARSRLMAKIVKSEVHQIRLARNLPGIVAFGNVDGPRRFNSTFESPGYRVATDWEDAAVITPCPGCLLLFFEHF